MHEPVDDDDGEYKLNSGVEMNGKTSHYSDQTKLVSSSSSSSWSQRLNKPDGRDGQELCSMAGGGGLVGTGGMNPT